MSCLTEQIIAEARSWVGVRYRHRGRSRRRGVDCVGLILEVGRAVDAAVPEGRFFTKDEYAQPYDRLKDYFDIKPRRDAVPGDLLVFQYGYFGTHFGIAVDVRDRLGFIHVDNKVGRVVQNALAGSWCKRFSRCYAFREKSA